MPEHQHAGLSATNDNHGLIAINAVLAQCRTIDAALIAKGARGILLS